MSSQPIQVLAWETTRDGFSFQYTSDDKLIIEHDAYLQPSQTTLPGQVKIPFTDVETLKRFVKKIEAIQNGEALPAPSLYIAS